MTLQQLKYVIAVADTGTLTKAAKQLFISQPSLTNSIHALEKEMNIEIFRRTNKGIVISKEGEEFLGYARQVLEQSQLLEERYKGTSGRKLKFCVSTQHYSFAVNAFVELIKEYGKEKYDFCLRETQTYEIIEDVAKMKSEIGVLYLNDFNQVILNKELKSNELKFTELLVAKPHVFISSKHPLAKEKKVTFKDLEEYPYLSFEQGEHNSFYYSEEIFSSEEKKKNIRVRDRATLFNLLIGLNGYTVCSGVIDKELNADQVKDIDEDYDKTVGKENDITIKNLVNPKKMVIQTGTAKVEIDSDYADMVETKRIDGRLYLAVPLTSNDILVDGCAVRTEALSDQDKLSVTLYMRE